MAIRDVVTRGFGNGTYDPGVNKIPTRGYSISAIGLGGPYTVDAADYYNAGSVESDFHNAGSIVSEES